MREFARILAPGGTLLLTDFHPDAAALGWRRTFRRDGQRVRSGELSVHGRTSCGATVWRSASARMRRSGSQSEGSLTPRAGPNYLRHACRIPAVLLTRWERDMRLDLTGHVVLPGLINAHDHLEFNLFPRLGRGPYANAGRVGARHLPSGAESNSRAVARAQAGAAVVGRAEESAERRDHGLPSQSLRARSLRRGFSGARGAPLCVGALAGVRAGPGGAAFARCRRAIRFWCIAPRAWMPRRGARCRRLDELGALDERTAIVHGVGLTAAGVALMRRRRASLVWCPTSNLAMLGRTVSRTVLRSGIPMALATDSALSAPVDLLDELAVARKYLPAERLYEMVTSEPARILRLARRREIGSPCVRRLAPRRRRCSMARSRWW